MTTQPQHGDRRFIRAATADGYWVQEYDAYDCFWHSVKFAHHADESEVTPMPDVGAPDLNKQARTTALALVYQAASVLMEAPELNREALMALDSACDALGGWSDWEPDV